MSSAMATTTSRAQGVMLAGAALAGWLAGSTLNPPVAVTQVAAPRPVATPMARTELPHVRWPAATRRVGPPAPSRNPFSFRAAAPVAAARRVVAAARDEVPVAAASSAMDDAALAPAPRWRLSGIATSDGGDVVAVISGGGDVHLMRAGEALPGGDDVVEVGPSHVVVRTTAGLLTLRLP